MQGIALGLGVRVREGGGQGGQQGGPRQEGLNHCCIYDWAGFEQATGVTSCGVFKALPSHCLTSFKHKPRPFKQGEKAF